MRGAYGATHRQYAHHDGLPRPQAGRAREGRHASVAAREDRRGVRDDPRRHRSEDGRHAVSGPYVIGCDVGSQGTNAALYAADGKLVASAYEAYDLDVPAPGMGRAGPRPVDGGGGADVPAAGRRVPGRRLGDPRALVRVAARRHGRVRRLGPPPAPRDDLDGPSSRGAGGGHRGADLAPRTSTAPWERTSTRRTRSSRRCGSATRSRSAGREAAHRCLPARTCSATRPGHRGRSVERVVPGAARSEDEALVAEALGGDRDRSGDAPGARRGDEGRSGP